MLADESTFRTGRGASRVKSAAPIDRRYRKKLTLANPGGILFWQQKLEKHELVIYDDCAITGDAFMQVLELHHCNVAIPTIAENLGSQSNDR